MRGVALTLAFGVELALLAAVAYVGFQVPADTPVRVVVAVVAVGAVGALWGVLLAPRSSRRLSLWPRLALETVLFGAAALALAATGNGGPAAVFAGVVVVRFALGLATGADAADI